MQSRIKELEKIERIEIPPKRRPSTSRFPQPKPSGRIVAEFQNVSQELRRARGVRDGEFRHRARRPGGAGGRERRRQVDADQDSGGRRAGDPGEYMLGHNAQPDYFAQDQYKELDPDARILDDLAEVAPRATNTELRTILGSFLFSEDDVFKTHRRAFGRRAQPLRAGAHADDARRISCCSTSPRIISTCGPRKCCWSALENSPARWSSSRTTATSSINWRRASSKWRTARYVYPGNYEDYLWRKSGKPLNLDVANAIAAPVNGASAADTATSPTSSGKRLNPLKLQKLRDRCAAIEADIARHESEIAALESDLANFRSTDETLRITKVLEGKRTSLESLMSEWENLSAEIESAS